jgi:hypothetical protein
VGALGLSGRDLLYILLAVGVLGATAALTASLTNLTGESSREERR